VRDVNDLESEFSLALSRFLRYFNLIERNVGLSISVLKSPENPRSIYRGIDSKNYEQKLEMFSGLVNSERNISDSEARKLKNWVESARSIRPARNAFVHGYWDLLPLSDTHPIHLTLHPGVREDIKATSPTRMTMEELDAAAIEVKQIFEEFVRLRRELQV
jgi:hypothetical protein